MSMVCERCSNDTATHNYNISYQIISPLIMIEYVFRNKEKSKVEYMKTDKPSSYVVLNYEIKM